MQHMKSKEEFNQYEFEQIELVQSSEQKSSSTGRVKYFFYFDSTQNGEISLWKFSIKKPHLPKINSRQNVSSCPDGNLPPSNLKV